MGCCGGDMGGIKGWFKSLGIYGYLLVGLLIVVAAYFIIVHQAHLAAYSTIIILIVFFGLHMVMCGMGHKHGDDHAGHEGHGDAGSGDDPKNKQKEKNDDQKKGGSCH